MSLTEAWSRAMSLARDWWTALCDPRDECVTITPQGLAACSSSVPAAAPHKDGRPPEIRSRRTATAARRPERIDAADEFHVAQPFWPEDNP